MTKKGQRNNLKQLEGTDSLPDEIVKVDLKYQEVYNNTVTELRWNFGQASSGLNRIKETSLYDHKSVG